MADDLQTVRGRLTITSDQPFTLIDPLAEMPAPTGDLAVQRTWPGAPEVGKVAWERIDDDSWWFYAILPRRLEDVGSTHRGLFANGAWYPQPVFADGLHTAAWDVTVHLPEGAVGAVGDVADGGVVRWQGAGERASLAVSYGRITALDEDGLHLDVITRHKPRRVVMRRLANEITRARPADVVWHGVVAQAPLRRRLARPGVGLTYISDRAWRVSRPFQRFHDVAVTRAVVSGLTEVADPYARDLASSAISWHYAQKRAGLDADTITGIGSFVPRLNAIRYDARLPFWADVLESAYPGDPLADDLVERFDPHEPGSAVIAQLADGWGANSVTTLGQALVRGHTVADAASLAGVPGEWLLARSAPLPARDLVLEVDKNAGEYRVLRSAPFDAPMEPVVVRVGDTPSVWRLGPGPDVRREEFTGGPIVVDPQHHVLQRSRVGDRWPERLDPTVAAWVTGIDPRHAVLEAGVYGTLRRTYATRFLAIGELYTDRRTRFGGELGAIFKLGPLVDGVSRRQQITITAGPAWFDPRYVPVERTFALGAGIAWRYDSRDDDFFPLNGLRLAASVDGGLLPSGSSRWGTARASLGGVIPVVPRFVLAAETSAGVATGSVEHRLLPLGGEGGLRSVPAELAIGTQRGIARFELRAAPIRGANVPLGLWWATELQLTAGGEVGTVLTPTGRVSAAGATAGVAAVVDWFGIEPALIGVTGGWRVWHQGLNAENSAVPEVWLRFGQAF